VAGHAVPGRYHDTTRLSTGRCLSRALPLHSAIRHHCRYTTGFAPVYVLRLLVYFHKSLELKCM